MADNFRKVLYQRILQDLESSSKSLEVCTDPEDSLCSYLWNGETSTAYIPFLDTENISMALMDEIQTKLSNLRPGCSIMLCIADTADTILYYKMNHGITERKAAKMEEKPCSSTHKSNKTAARSKTY